MFGGSVGRLPTPSNLLDETGNTGAKRGQRKSETRANTPNGNNADGPVVSAGPVGVFAVVHRTQSLP